MTCLVTIPVETKVYISFHYIRDSDKKQHKNTRSRTYARLRGAYYSLCCL